MRTTCATFAESRSAIEEVLAGIPTEHDDSRTKAFPIANRQPLVCRLLTAPRLPKWIGVHVMLTK